MLFLKIQFSFWGNAGRVSLFWKVWMLRKYARTLLRCYIVEEDLKDEPEKEVSVQKGVGASWKLTWLDRTKKS